MTNIVLPIEIEPGVEMLSRLRQMSEDEFFYFCQENTDHKFERNTDGTIIPMAQTGGETGRRNSRLTSRLDFWTEKNRQRRRI